MAKIIGFVVMIIAMIALITTGVQASFTIYDYVQAKYAENGPPENLDIKDITETKLGYTITYNLEGGICDNPTNYNLFSSDIKFNKPVKENHKFTGWTGSNGNVPQIDLILKSGSCGDLILNANYELLVIETPDDVYVDFLSLKNGNSFITYDKNLNNRFQYVVNFDFVDSNYNYSLYCNESIVNGIITSINYYLDVTNLKTNVFERLTNQTKITEKIQTMEFILSETSTLKFKTNFNMVDFLEYFRTEIFTKHFTNLNVEYGHVYFDGELDISQFFEINNVKKIEVKCDVKFIKEFRL